MCPQWQHWSALALHTACQNTRSGQFCPEEIVPVPSMVSPNQFVLKAWKNSAWCWLQRKSTPYCPIGACRARYKCSTVPWRSMQFPRGWEAPVLKQIISYCFLDSPVRPCQITARGSLIAQKSPFNFGSGGRVTSLDQRRKFALPGYENFSKVSHLTNKVPFIQVSFLEQKARH